MAKSNLGSYFENFLIKDSLFRSKQALQTNYDPEAILHRDEQMQQIADVLAPSLRMEKPSNLFLYGNTGTGKTLTTKYATSELASVAKKQSLGLRTVYINCKLKRTADTEYRLIAQLLRDLGREVPATGLPTEELYKILFNILNSSNDVIILILDEIDYLVNKIGDGFLYNFTRMHESTNSKISIIGISNDLTFIDNVDARVKSSLSEEEIVFPPYNAYQIQNILRERAKVAFKEDVISPGVIEKCAAHAAREHGDARRALELLRVAGEIAERASSKKILLAHIDEAENKIDRDRIYDVVSTQPRQYQLTLFSIISLASAKKGVIFTGEIYDFYKSLCDRFNVRPLTHRRISDIIAEYDMLGIVNAKIISKGRYGRTREITISLPKESLGRLSQFLEKELGL
ncbi:orc1/cdc6 family replication initiation protein [Candidatus Woesearchaeota archaeon]|nr:orc1/cdc6 family replication initiation protein [Candidatus Woesearchaeota archaeon]